MPRTTRNQSNSVFDALAAPLRLRILRLVYSQGPLSYSEIMSRLNLNPNRDAGKFAYHLRKLHNAGLLTTDVTKKYVYTPLGSLMVEVTQNVETESLRQRRKLLVRTSRLAMEEFDRNKIVRALMREAGVPAQLARKIAEETEERLLKLDALYLTAPLIREFVNAVLIEKGLHEYRHRHTRLGIPVYDVAQSIKQVQTSPSGVQEVGNLMARNVLTEFVLLDVLPRRVADAHLDGSLHLNNIEDWVLKPDSILHDLRPFLRMGFDLQNGGVSTLFLDPPDKLSEALGVVSSVLSSCAREIGCEQTIPHFNLFLAPFVKGVSDQELKSDLESFIITLNQFSYITPVSLIVDFAAPRTLNGDFPDEALRIAEGLLEILAGDAVHGPMFCPRLVLNVTRDDRPARRSEDVLMKAHELAAVRGTPIFVNLDLNWQKDALYDSNGMRLAATWTTDWELDTMRTGTLGMVGINIPRIAYENKGSETKFFSALREALSMATEALKVKALALDNLFSGRIPSVLSRPTAGENYFRVKNASFLIGLIGVNEATMALTGKQLHEDKGALDFASKMVSQLSTESRRLSDNSGFRLGLAHGAIDGASERLAELDVEKYGWEIVNAQGTHEAPYYTDLTACPLDAKISLQDRLHLEGIFHPLMSGGHLLPVELSEPQQHPDALIRTTKELMQNENVGAYAFTRTYGLCHNCKKTHGGHYQKCPNCGATDAYTTFSRLSSNYSRLNRWPKGKAATLDRRVRYRL